MRKFAAASLALIVALIVVLPVAAGSPETVTLEGEMQCARCTLHEEGLDKCQNVLLVNQDGEESLYYLAANETNAEHGDVCMNSQAVRVTGQLEEKDGRMWIAASEIATLETEG